MPDSKSVLSNRTRGPGESGRVGDKAAPFDLAVVASPLREVWRPRRERPASPSGACGQARLRRAVDQSVAERFTRALPADGQAVLQRQLGPPCRNEVIGQSP